MVEQFSLRWGRFVHRHRYVVLVVFLALVALSGFFGRDLGDRLTQGGWFDESSESVVASKLADQTFGRDRDADVIVLYTAPAGHTVDDPAVREPVTTALAALRAKYPEQVQKIDSYFDGPMMGQFADASRTHAFASIGLRGEDTESVTNYLAVKDDLGAGRPGGGPGGTTVELAGLQPVVEGINIGMQHDIHRAELIALPIVAVLLFFVFGGVVGALLPVLIGGMTVLGSQGMMRLLTDHIEVNVFASAVVTLVSLGLAIDYGLFAVTRFREELAAGRSVEDATARTVATAGRTVLFSAAIIAVSIGALFIYPNGVLRSVPYGGISSVLLAALLSVTALPAALSIVGRRIDLFSWRQIAGHDAHDALSEAERAARVEEGQRFFSRLALFAMRRPVRVIVPVVLGLLILLIPFRDIAFGGLSERYLAADAPARVAQERFDALFPGFRTEPLKLVVVGADPQQLSDIRFQANFAPGLTGPFEASAPTTGGINVLSTGLVDEDDADAAIATLRAIDHPPGVRVMVAGVPALERDAITGLIRGLPLLAAILVLAALALMYVAFRSLVLAVKAVVMSALSLGATLGVLTWIFVEGHGAGLFHFTPGPLMFAVLVLIVTVLFGLSTDYEVFLQSRMAEARANGAPPVEAIRYGIAHTGGVITSAAAILIVVTGAFGFSDLVLMKYIAYGMIAALILDATVIRLLLTPAVLKLVWR
ncbi:RND superfamily putative drug exporter [Nocardia transvalensis]|uniref:RND superfamily putative drug exporter n=1 Tax=Nocardia transvalensis TaxID=37333 RepID=A0A7W9UKF5_9NOCA|nr:MMPL family transporter [Nocardia transvalensis]MBB5916503.1 RND superfamily putative drug exporter [Nocardia transvalensis]